MKLFKKSLTFAQPDPLGDGLAEQIRAEQKEAQNYGFDANFDGDALANSWETTLEDLRQDPDWFDLASTD